MYNHFKKLSLSLLLAIYSANHYAADKLNSDIILVYKQPGFVRLDFQPVKMPFGEKNMGLTGIHYLAKINNQFNFGGGVLGGITGQRGGLFILGLEGEFSIPITNKVSINTGLYAGGGGGNSASVGGGIVLNTHAGISYQLDNKLKLGVAYADLNFMDGDIRSQQVKLSIDIPFEYRYAPFDYQGIIRPFKNFSFINSTSYPSLSYISLIAHRAITKSNQHLTGGKTRLPQRLDYIGAELGHYITNNYFVFAQAEAMIRGLRGGYMQILGGMGYDYPLLNKLHLLPKLALGAGGGGGVNTGGGFLVYPELTAEYKVKSNLAVNLSLGKMFAPDGQYQLTTFGAGVKYISQSFYHPSPSQPEKLQGWQLSVSHESYPNVKRHNRREHVGLIQGQLDYIVSNYLYLAAQTDFAYLGNAGAYGEGLLGAGIKSNIFNTPINAFGQILAGASGGGGIDTKEGLVIKPSAGILVPISNLLGLRLAVSDLYSSHCKWHTIAGAIGLTYRISSISDIIEKV